MEIKEKDPLYEDEDEDYTNRITENEMNDIIAYINSWDYEKYQRDKEIREAFQLLKSKMIKDEKEKEKELNKLKKIEQNYTLSGVKMNQNENVDENINYREEDNNYNLNINNDNNNNEELLNNNKKEIKELTNEEKIILEKNWNNSTKIERNGQVINEKGDKDILINNENLEEKKNDKLFVKYIYLLLLFFRNKYLIIQTIN